MGEKRKYAFILLSATKKGGEKTTTLRIRKERDPKERKKKGGSHCQRDATTRISPIVSLGRKKKERKCKICLLQTLRKRRKGKGKRPPTLKKKGQSAYPVSKARGAIFFEERGKKKGGGPYIPPHSQKEEREGALARGGKTQNPKPIHTA